LIGVIGNCSGLSQTLFGIAPIICGYESCCFTSLLVVTSTVRRRVQCYLCDIISGWYSLYGELGIEVDTPTDSAYSLLLVAS